jgi:hypothetical protein
MRGVHGIVDDASAAWDRAVADFRQKEIALVEAERTLFNAAAQAQSDPVDAAEWQRLMNDIQAMQVTLETVHSALASITQGWTDFGEWVTRIPEPVADELMAEGSLLSGVRNSRLGAAQFILPISLGALAAATATMAAIAASVAGFLTYLSMKGADLENLESDVEALRATGATEPEIQTYVRKRTQAATESAQNKANYSFTADIARIAMWIGIGLLAVFVLPPVLKMLPGKKSA